LSFCSICHIDKCYNSKIATFATVTVIHYCISVVTVIGATVILVTAILVTVTKVFIIINVIVNMFAFMPQLIC
jgi:hypothetical protein